MSDHSSTAIAQQIKDGEKARQEHNAQEDAVVRLVLPMFPQPDGKGTKPLVLFMSYREGKMLEFELSALLTKLKNAPTRQDGTGQEPI